MATAPVTLDFSKAIPIGAADTQPGALQSAVAYGATQDPDQYANLLKLQKATGVPPAVSNGNQAQVRQAADVNSIDYPKFAAQNPRTTAWASNPDNAAVSGVNEVQRLGSIEQNAAQMRAATPWENFSSSVHQFNETANKAVMEYPLTRSLVDVAAGTAGMAGNIGSFLGWHGDGPTKQNLLQRIETSLSPEANLDPASEFAKSNGLDWLMKNVAPMVPAVVATGGTSLLARALGLSPTVAKVLSGLTVGGLFDADQAGKTYTALAGSGASDYAARLAANRAAAISAIPNALFGATDVVPLLRDNPLLTSLGLGGATGATGQIGQNVVTKQPWNQGVGAAAVQGAAAMGGMHIGMGGFGGSMTDAVDAAEQSKLRERSPEKFNEAMQTIFAGDQSLRVPVEQFSSYFKGKGMDPADVAKGLSSTNYPEAVLSGGDVEIPPADFMAKLDPEHQKALLGDIVDPGTGLTARQHQEGLAELQQWATGGGAAKLAADTAAADAETASTPEYTQVKEQLRQRYTDAGETPEVAETLATKDANAYNNLARNAGMKPSELLNLYNPKVTIGEAPEGGNDMSAHVNAPEPAPAEIPKAESLEHQQAVEGIREVVDAAKQPGHAPQKATIAAADPWLVETAKQHGLDIDGFNHVIDGSAVRHVINKHGDETAESQQGQIAVTDKDFDRLPDVLAAPDRVVFGTKNKRGLDQIGYAKRMEDGSTLYIEETRRGRKELAAVSMRKFPATMDADRVAANLHLDAQNDGIAPIVVQHPSADKVTDAGEVLHQSSEAGPRGWFRVLSDGTYEIGKTKIGDLSTFVHEPAHAYLKILGDLSKRDGASNAIKGDYQKVLEYLGAKDGEPLTREQQETWANANEQYLREGKAPSPGLKGAFQRFAIWLGNVYRKASALGVEGVELTPEIRGVMDRLYASEQGVNRAEAEAGPRLFNSPEEAGWTQEQFNRYAEDNKMSAEQAHSHILGMMNEAAVRARSEAWRDEEQNVREAVTADVDQKPEYSAIRSLRKGALDDGTELTMSRDGLVKQFGEERVKELQKTHPGLYRNEAGDSTSEDPEVVAETFGYNSAEEMMRALEAAPRRASAIETATRDYMTAKHGDIRYDGTLDDQARIALENDQKAQTLHEELTALKQKVAGMTGRADAVRAIDVAPIASYREAAQQMIEKKSPADLQPTRYLDASRKYSREAFDAVRAGDAQKAAEAKHKELMNHFLFRDATNAKEYLGKFEAFVKRTLKPAAQSKLGLAGGDYRDQVNRILGRYGLGPQVPAGGRSLGEWAADQYQQGKEPAIDPAILNEARTINYRSAPMSEIRQVHDALTNIRKLASLELGMTVNGKRIEFAAAVSNMEGRARESLPTKPTRYLERNATTGEKVTDFAQRGNALLMRTEFIMKRLDGGETGPWHDNLWHLAADAQGNEYALQRDVTKRIGDAFDNMSKEQRAKMLDKVTVPGIPETVTRHDLISMAFNMGNEGNLDRLQKTFMSRGWDPDAPHRIAGMLTREEWQFVQDGWDSLKPLGKAQAELEQRMTGLPPIMVKPTPLHLELNDGTVMDVAGGYYPIVMDPKYSVRGAQADAGTTAQNLMEAGYGRAATSRGNMQTRTAFGGPMQLDYEQVLTQHTAKVIKDITHREFMLAANKMLLDPQLRQSVRETLGDGYEEKMMPWLRTIINDRNGSAVQGLGDVSRIMRALRMNLVKAALTFKVSTVLLQVTHASSMFNYTSPGSYAQSMISFLAHPIEMSAEIRNLSPNEMASRGENIDRDLRTLIQTEAGKKGVGHAIARAGMAPVQFMDHMMSFPLWHAVYQDALTAAVNLPEKEAQYQAMQKADGAVRMGLGSNAPKDLPPIMRNNDFTKLITTLGGFHNLKWNQMSGLVSEAPGRGLGKLTGGGLGKLTYGMLLTAVIPATLGALVTGHGPKDGENAGLWAAKRALLFPAETIPVLGNVVEGLEGKGDVSFSPLQGMFERAAKAGARATADNDNKDWLGIGMDFTQSAMDAFGVVGTDQVLKTARYARQASKGNIESPSVWDAVAGSGRR